MTLNEVMDIARDDHCLAVVATLRPDLTIQSTIVNAGVLPHPRSGDPVVGFVTYGQRKLVNLRTNRRVTITFRAGWRWATVEGEAEMIGPDEPKQPLSPEQFRLLLREVFTAAGGTHYDWDDYDRTMKEQRRAVVLVTPTRIYSNRPSG
ncbi:MAG: TIGR03618 family F420-dependent PPOX class oxidoreductase [Acidimicrobiales bacterium]